LTVLLDLGERQRDEVSTYLLTTDWLPGYQTEILPTDHDWSKQPNVVVADMRAGMVKWVIYGIVECTVIALHDRPSDMRTLAAHQTWASGAFIPASSSPDRIAAAIALAYRDNSLLLPADQWPAIRALGAIVDVPTPSDAQNRYTLTERQVDVLLALTQGMSTPRLPPTFI
jgi:DNA-binding NarL/FixJ family response regulator